MRTALVIAAAAALALGTAQAGAQTASVNGGMAIGSGSHPPSTNGPRNATGEGGGAALSNCPPGGSTAAQSHDCPPYSGSSSLGGTGTGTSAEGTGTGPQPVAPPQR